jgi:hypothetical protein
MSSREEGSLSVPINILWSLEAHNCEQRNNHSPGSSRKVRRGSLQHLIAAFLMAVDAMRPLKYSDSSVPWRATKIRSEFRGVESWS